MKGSVVARRAVRRAFVCTGLWLGAGCASAPADSVPRAEARQQLASGRSAYEQRQWKAASVAFGRAALIFAALSESSAETAALRDQGEALRRAGDLETAVAVDQRALELDRRLGHRQDQARDLGGLARCAAAQQKTALAIQTAEDALALVDAGTPLAAVLENDLALYLLARGESGDPARARELLSSALASNQAQRDALGAASNELNLGRAEFASGDSKLAESHLERALEGFRALQDLDGLAQTHEM
ncbi:MAG TPA: tetratricopeptide repeat protein, partial [Myxococcota bacterium]|nr:tetratricopeptide repeat protein [Myxococcota bacterium]